MANPEHLAILKQGVKVWNDWREMNPSISPDLSTADLKESDLTDFNFGANFIGDKEISSDLRSANLLKANLHNTDLNHADLREANLASADLFCTNLGMSDLREAKLQNAKLTAANLRNTNLEGAILRRAAWGGTYLEETNLTGADVSDSRMIYLVFANVDLSNVTGLETVIHNGPSTIGIDTIFRSQGKIPEVFLRGSGVPDIFIEYARALVGRPIHFFSCFISHSVKDKRFCERLYVDLRAKGVGVWYFPEDAKWGEPVWGEIDRSIRIYDKLIVVCSRNSLTSGPVLREIERALNREDKEGKNVLFPITIDDYIFKQWEHPRKADVLAKVVGDFRGWNRSAEKYDKALRKLLKALKAE